MFFFKLVLVFVVFSPLVTSTPLLGDGKQSDEFGRIVGGSPIDISQSPYQVAVLQIGSFTCGGSIISPKVVLTAAQCTE